MIGRGIAVGGVAALHEIEGVIVKARPDMQAVLELDLLVSKPGVGYVSQVQPTAPLPPRRQPT